MRIPDVSDAEEHINSKKVVPADLTELARWKVDSRAMLIILDGVKDHIVPHLSRNWEAKCPCLWHIKHLTLDMSRFFLPPFFFFALPLPFYARARASSSTICGLLLDEPEP